MQAITPLNTPNNTQNFLPIGEGWVMKQVPMKASTAAVVGTAIGVEISSNTTTGNCTVMPATNANGANFVGILAEKIASTDSDYATAGKLKSVWVPINKSVSTAQFTVGAGTFTAADVGRICNIHTDSASLSVDTNGAGAQITGFIDSSYGLCTFDVPLTTTA